METDRQVKLRIDNLSLSFGGVRALIEVSMDVRDNEILAIIGPNGAGKTALLNCINGFYEPQKGESYYDTLYQSSQGWHETQHPILPWWEYFLGGKNMIMISLT